MSRRGTPRTPSIMKDYPNVSYIKGDCLEVDSFKDVLPGITGCIHTVGTLIEKKSDYKKSYKAMNRDTAINMARELNAINPNSKIPFVYLSSAKAPPILSEYFTTKLEAE